MSGESLQGGSSLATGKSLLRHAFWVFVAVVVVAFLVLAVIGEVGHLPKIDWSFDFWWLVPAFVALVIFQGIHAETWRRILHRLHGDIPARKGWVIWNVSLLARYVPTQVMLAVTRVGMAEREGVPKRVTISSIVYEVALVTAASIVVAAWGIMSLPDVKNSPWRFAILLVPVAALACLHPKPFSRVSTYLLHRFKTEKLERTLGFRTVLLFAGVYVVSFLVTGIGVLCIARSLHSIDPADIPVVLSAWSVGYAGALVAFFVPGGLGVREGAMAAVLAIALPTGVAIAVAVVTRLAQTGVELLYAGASVLYARRMPELEERNADASAKESGVPIS
jgi:glycosyltransferase 2 family protein